MKRGRILGEDGFEDLSMGRSGVAAMAAFLTSQYGVLAPHQHVTLGLLTEATRVACAAGSPYTPCG